MARRNAAATFEGAADGQPDAGLIANAIIEQATVLPPRRTWLTEQFEANPNQVFELDPFNEDEIIIDTRRNARGYTPDIGDKSLEPLIAKIIGVKGDDGYYYGGIGQTTPCFATLNDQGTAVLYAGFRRARAWQTIIETLGITELDGVPCRVRVLITPEKLTDLQVYERSLSENTDREDMTAMQKVNALLVLTEPPNNLSLKLAAPKLNMSKAAASVYIRFNLFPAIAKQALDSGKLPYAAAEKFVALLPKRFDPDKEEDVALLEKAQQRIAAHVTAALARTGKVKTSETDKATRKMADASGAVANKTQRKTKLIVNEIDEQVQAVKELEKPTKAQERVAEVLAAFRKYVNGGSMKALVKALEG